MVGYLRRRLSYAGVMATIAVFVALGGSSYAAVQLTGKNVRDGSLSGADVRDNSLKSADVRNGSLRLSDFKAGEFAARRAGAQGGPRHRRYLEPVQQVRERRTVSRRRREGRGHRPARRVGFLEVRLRRELRKHRRRALVRRGA